MSNIKRWTLCAFLFLVCLYILKILNVKSEGYRGGCRCSGGCRCGCRGYGRGLGLGMGLGMGGYGRGLGLTGYY
jgi:hypothetical protein